MLGNDTSMPYVAVPFDLAAESRRGIGLPTMVKSAAALSVISDGRCDTASAASSPKRNRRPSALITVPCSARQVDAVTPQVAAAAAMSDARADAPASRIGIQQSRTLDDPPVIMTPSSRAVLAIIQRIPRTSVPSASGANGSPSTSADTLP